MDVDSARLAQVAGSSHVRRQSLAPTSRNRLRLVLASAVLPLELPPE